MNRAVSIVAASLFAGLGAQAAELEARSPDCPPPARYVMPEGVELAPQGEDKSGVAPADVPGSRAGFSVPPQIRFNLAINPVGPTYNQSQLDLGQVEIDRKTGKSSIDGQPLGGADPCAAKQDKPAKR